jgi:hypothetical protein
MLPSQHDHLREKREREFQQRLLAVLEKTPKTARFAVINSPIVIWVLSAIFVTLGGGYYTTYHQCVDDARRITAAYTSAKYGNNK